ncbi:MAG: ISAs1 family transposase [Oscillospiraceae bacterium]|nr:ISAs1 family transposase [Oscillospiraceae bacterium]
MRKYFEEIEDTRQQWKIKYLLVEVIVMAIVAVTAGADTWGEIAMYCKGKIKMFREKFGLKLENGVPTDDTFQRIFAIIKPKQLEKCFRNWVNSVFQKETNEIISLDGKTICGSRTDDYSFIHMVSAWACETGIVLGQLRVDDKSNEITAVPQHLDLIEAENCIFTSDAMSCQKKTVEKIVSKHCDYVICLKGNQETLHEDVKLYFETALAEPKLYDFVKSKPKTEKGHGRIETRQYFLSTEISDFISAEEWKGIAAIGMVRSKRIINEEESVENRYFITSLTDLQKFSNAVRKHWGIENELHWCLDMNFDEDRCRTRVDNSGENLAVIRHISLNLYKAFTSVKLSMKAKRFRCSFDDNFLCSVIFNKFS